MHTRLRLIVLIILLPITQQSEIRSRKAVVFDVIRKISNGCARANCLGRLSTAISILFYEHQSAVIVNYDSIDMTINRYQPCKFHKALFVATKIIVWERIYILTFFRGNFSNTGRARRVVVSDFIYARFSFLFSFLSLGSCPTVAGYSYRRRLQSAWVWWTTR